MSSVSEDLIESDSKCSVELPVRGSHNIVEKRYRMSINDKLGELRELVDGKDSKVCLHTLTLCVSLSLCLSVCLSLCLCVHLLCVFVGDDRLQLS